jgi:hypothetical protein
MVVFFADSCLVLDGVLQFFFEFDSLAVIGDGVAAFGNESVL